MSIAVDIQQFVDIRRSGAVKRYHTVPTIGEQTLAAHQWHAAMILHYLEPNARKEVLLAVLTHDVPELRFGDIPSPAKRSMSPEFRRSLQTAEDHELRRLGISYELDSFEINLVIQADLLELLWYCLEQRRLGNIGMNEIFARGVEYLGNIEICQRAREMTGYIMQEYGRL